MPPNPISGVENHHEKDNESERRTAFIVELGSIGFPPRRCGFIAQKRGA